MPTRRPYYSHLAVHRLMLRDAVRTHAFRDALRAVVRPGDVVLDVGAGTGILSLFAAQAGAARVYAVERTSIARTARALIERNGFSDRIHVLNDDIERVSLPERVDVIVSEWLGTLAVDENMLSPVVMARERWLKRGGRMVPERVTTFVTPVWNEELSTELEWRSGSPYGLDLRLVMPNHDPEVWRVHHARDTWAPIVTPHAAWTVDATTVTRRVASAAFRTAFSCTAKREGRINALATWFDARLGGGVSLTNAPMAPSTHWGQYVFPLHRAFDVGRGKRLDIKFASIPNGPGQCRFEWSVREQGQRWEHHRAG